MTPRLAFALDAAHRAGRRTLAHFQTGAPIEYKQDGSPLTRADTEAEREIRDLISQEYPRDAVLGEEEGGRLEGGTGWVIDPIDGTKSFVCGVPLYATLLSFEESGEPLVAVCYLPALGEVVYAEKGAGAFWNGRPCRVSKVRSMEEATLSCGSHASMDAQGRAQGLAQLAQVCRATRTWTDAYGHALVATGRIEAMIDPVVRPWDISSMRLIVVEAGGRCTDFRGGRPPGSEAISSNGLLHSLIIEAFAS